MGFDTHVSEARDSQYYLKPDVKSLTCFTNKFICSPDDEHENMELFIQKRKAKRLVNNKVYWDGPNQAESAGYDSH